jgi:soluble lytic murein transglycosylase-like protein
MRRLAFILAFSGLHPALAHADVLDIAPDGARSWRRGAMAVQWRDDSVPVVSRQSPAPASYAAILQDAAARQSISPALLEALIWQESRWHPDAVSPAGAVGLGQLMPATARHLGVDPRDPRASIHGAARYLREQIDHFGGNLELALAAYNAGPGRVERAGGVPAIAETRAYVRAITNRLIATTSGDGQ